MEKRQPKYVELVNWIREQIDGNKIFYRNGEKIEN